MQRGKPCGQRNLLKWVREHSIGLFVVIQGAKRVRLGALRSITELVHMWGSGGITIGNDVLIAAHARITSVTHEKAALAIGRPR